MKKIFISISIIIFAVTSTAAPALAANVGPWSVPSWLQGLSVSLDPTTGQLVSDSGLVLENVTVTGERVLVKEVEENIATTFLEKLAGSLKVGTKLLGKLGSAEGMVAIGVLMDPLSGTPAMNVQLCVDATHDDFKSFASDCPKNAVYKPSTPLKLRWSIVSEYDNTTCSGFGAWDESIQQSDFLAGNKILQISRPPGTYPYYIGCEGTLPHSLFGDIVQLNFVDFFKDLWKVITGQSLNETVMAFSEVIVDVVNVQPTSPTLSVSLTATPNNITLPAGGGSVTTYLTATVGGTAQGTINYTFYCNRSDAGVNITSPDNGKFDDKSNTSQPSSCSYSSPGVYAAKVIVERGSLAAQAYATVVVNPPPATPNKPYVEIKLQ
jgi:hypothetical protein